MTSKTPATIWRFGTVNVSSGFRMANLGYASGPNTCPILSFCPRLVMTAPPFISLPVPAMVSTQPTGTTSHSTSSKRR